MKTIQTSRPTDILNKFRSLQGKLDNFKNTQSKVFIDMKLKVILAIAELTAYMSAYILLTFSYALCITDFKYAGCLLRTASNKVL